MGSSLKLATIGCGERGRVYSSLAAKQHDKFYLVAGADPVKGRVDRMQRISGNSDFRGFDGAESMLAEDKLADVAIISTQDNYHFDPCCQALIKGYDVLLEKPAAQRIDEVIKLDALASKLGRRVVVCHVLRYTPFYRKVKAIIESGVLGDIITINANEGVMPWHQAHSFVRGHWADTEKASPMIAAKSCHDMDIMHWLIGCKCLKISSFGSLTHFRPDQAPAGAPLRCADGCPHQSTCEYNAHRYATDHKDPWLAQIFDKAATATTAEIEKWLETTPWGRCAYHCDNTAVDHQVVNMEFEDEITATFTMTAFETGRHIEIYGTKGILRGGDFYRKHTGHDIHVIEHSGKEQAYAIEVPHEDEGNVYHGGGDAGMINNLFNEMTAPACDKHSSSLSSALHGHVMAFAAEKARMTGDVIDVAEFQLTAMASSS